MRVAPDEASACYSFLYSFMHPYLKTTNRSSHFVLPMLAPQQYAYLWKALIKTSPKIGLPPKIMAFRGRCRPLKAPWLLVVRSNHTPLSIGIFSTDSFRTSLLEVCFMAFEIKGQTKAMAAFIGILGTYWSNLACRHLIRHHWQLVSWT